MSVPETVDATVTIPADGAVSMAEYDAWENRRKPAAYSRKKADESMEDSFALTLTLSPYEMKIFYVSGDSDDMVPKKARPGQEGILVEGPWKLSLKKAGEDKFIYERDLFALKNLTSGSFWPNFSGTMKYETSVIISRDGRKEGPNEDGGQENKTESILLDLGEVYETAEVWINGQRAGCRIAPPYRFDVTSRMKEGKNEVEVLVTNTLVHQQKDRMSVTLPVEPSGLLGPVRLLVRE